MKIYSGKLDLWKVTKVVHYRCGCSKNLKVGWGDQGESTEADWTCSSHPTEQIVKIVTTEERMEA